MSSPDPSVAIPVFVCILSVVLLAVGVFTQRAINKGYLKLPEKEKPAPKYVLVECDCGQDTVCPQGRTSDANPYRCKVQKIVYEGTITRSRGVFE